ncbi:MAG: hypothetical protein Q7S22_03635, partial [Candidatus Micrarchaeota archaeon]|nr:hypothetical protein [Candidatus Micrarchaeota archaeon]
MGRLVFGVLTMAPERRMPKIALAEPLLEQVDKKAEFKRWLVLFFIQRGQFKITDNGYAELAPQVQRQSLEFGEPVSNRTREPRMEERRGLTKKEIKELVSRRVEEMLAEGKTEELYTRGLIDRQKKFDWKDKEVRMIVIKQLLKILGKKPVDVDHDDFKSCGLDGFLKSRYNDSPYLALIEAGYAYSLDEVKEHGKTGKFKTDRIYPWEITKTPRIYDDKEIRIAATKWLLWKLKIEPRKITTTVFRKNGARGVTAYCNGSPYLALIEAGYAYSLDEVKEHGKTGKFKTDKIYPW